MILHIVSQRLVVAELSAGKKFCCEGIKELVSEELRLRGLEPWSSIEVELFQCEGGTLAFAVPVRVLLPESLLRLAAQLGVDT